MVEAWFAKRRMDGLKPGKLTVGGAHIVCTLDSAFKWRFWTRVSIQSTLFFGGLGVVRLGMDLSRLLVVVGVVLSSIAAGLALMEILFHVFVRRLLKGGVVRWFRRALDNNQNLRRTFIAARMDQALGAWLSRKCPRLNCDWVRDELERLELD